MSTSLAAPVSHWVRAVSSEGATFNDTSASTRILATVGVLAAVGVLLLLITWWWWRSTRPEPEALAPLAVIGTRKFRHGNDDQRRKALASARPGAVDAASATPAVEFPDLAALAARDLPPTSDLADDMFPPFDMSPPLTAPETD